jgi:hypothetical protein
VLESKAGHGGVLGRLDAADADAGEDEPMAITPRLAPIAASIR